jgi:hypothetical protein
VHLIVVVVCGELSIPVDMKVLHGIQMGAFSAAISVWMLSAKYHGCQWYAPMWAERKCTGRYVRMVCRGCGRVFRRAMIGQIPVISNGTTVLLQLHGGPESKCQCEIRSLGANCATSKYLRREGMSRSRTCPCTCSCICGATI